MRRSILRLIRGLYESHTMETRVLVIKYANRLPISAIPLFRGAVIGAMDGSANVLYHNHSGESVVYHYPLIQYKRIDGCAAIVAIDGGADIIGQFLSSGVSELTLGKRKEIFTISNVFTTNSTINVNEDDCEYCLHHWLPFNSENYREYKFIEDLALKVQFMEKILVGNIMSLAKGVGVSLTSNVTCRIKTIDYQRLATYKGVKMMSFDLVFKSNVTLPDFVGIGKGVSLGFGTVSRRHQEK